MSCQGCDGCKCNPMISGFTFIHNAFRAGLPIREAILSVYDYVDEMVVVDCQSDDGTRQWLNDNSAIRVIDGEWGNEAGKTLAAAHALHAECRGEVIIHFEADEVFAPELIKTVRLWIEQGNHDLAVQRLQVEQNFQRVRWYPEPVHRVFPRGSVIKQGHTTNRHNDAAIIGPEYGYLWDVTNCFRDQWLARVNQQAELWNEQPEYRAVPLHFNHSMLVANLERFLAQPHWEWQTTPLALPDILRPLVGKVRYE